MRDQIGNIEPKTNAVEAAIKKYDREMEEHVSESESESEEDDDDEPNATSSRERISAAAKAAASKDPTMDGIMAGGAAAAGNGMSRAFAVYLV